MPDYGFLLGAQPIQSPNPLQLAGQGLTLGNMAQQQQMGALQLEKAQDLIRMFSDPNIAQSLLAPQAGGGFDMSALAGHPAAPEFLSSVLGLQEKQADIAQKQASAGKARVETQKAVLDQVYNFAASLDPATVTPQQAGGVARWLASAGYDYTQFGGNDPASFVKNVAAGLQDPKQRQEIANAQVANEVAQMNAQREWLTANKPEVKLNELTGRFEHVAPFANFPPFPGFGGAARAQGTAPGLPKGASLNLTGPVSGQDIQGALADAAKGVTPSAAPTSPQVAQTPTQKVMTEAAKPELEQYIAKAGPAGQMKAMLEDLRNTEAQGVYSGGIQGTDFYRKMDNVLAAFGIDQNKIANLDKLANTQGYMAEAKTLIATAVSQFAGSRVAQKELNFFESAKPDLLMTPEGREQVYQKLWTISDRIQQQAKLAGEHFMAKGELTSFAPQFVNNKMPNPIVPGLPDAGGKEGWKAKGPDGTMYRSNGIVWVPQGAPPPPGQFADVPR